ncbi:hypothetical protein OS493_031615 [Desmophyllum pertusum]|uniref:Uncharacterized protein n=1 Tax=Desmophyllum pertusum TaxID=174260 RepID=A0A9W9YMI8_9CNID|nr:hypothetical protein OS493_031615 [Desmophyllum pertusum]
MSRFMFSKIALSLFQPSNSGKISTLSVQRNYLSLTVVHPVKARLTLWRKDRCIKQNIQLVQTAERNGLTDWTVRQDTFSEEPVENSSPCSVGDRFFWPAIDHLAKKYHVTCHTDVSSTDDPQDVSDAYCELMGDCQMKEMCSQISSEETERNEALRNCLSATTLENLTVVSEISRQFHGDGIQGTISLPGDDVTVMDPSKAETSSFANSSESQSLHQEIISSNYQQTEAEIQSQDLTLTAPDLAAGEANPLTRGEEKPMAKTEDDDNVLGRLLFEEKRKSRRSIMAELQQSLKKKETTSQLHFLENEQGPSDEAIQTSFDVVIDPKKTETSDMDHLQQIRTHKDSTSTSFEQPPFNSEADVRSKNLKPWSHDDESRATDDDIASGRIVLKKHSTSRNACIANLQDPNIEEISPKSDNLEVEKGLASETTHGNEDSVEDLSHCEMKLGMAGTVKILLRGRQHTQGCEKSDQGRQKVTCTDNHEDFAASNEGESSSVLGTGLKNGKEDYYLEHRNILETTTAAISKDEKQTDLDTATNNLRPKIVDGSTGVHQSQSVRRFIEHDVTKHQLQNNIHEFQRGTKLTATEVDMDKGTSQLKRDKTTLCRKEMGERREKATKIKISHQEINTFHNP